MGVRKAQKWSNLAVFRGPDPTAGEFSGGLLSGLENRGDEGSVSMRFRGAVSGAVEWRPFGTPDGRFLGTLEAVLGHAEAVLAPPLHEKMHVLVCTLLESFPAGASCACDPSYISRFSKMARTEAHR